MRNMLIIFRREYFEHVKKRSFIISTVLTPIIIPIVFVAAGFLMQSFTPKDQSIIVIDESGLFSDLSIAGHPLEFSEQSLEETLQRLDENNTHGILYIPAIKINSPRGIAYYSKSSPSLFFTNKVSAPLREQLRQLKMQELELDEALIKQLNISIDIKTFVVTEDGASKQTSSAASSIIGYIMGFMIYMFMIIYGTFIMQSVLTEKTSKVVEIILASVKPFNLMMGKILGVGAVAITQIVIWLTMLFIFTIVLTMAFNYSPVPPTEALAAASTAAQETPQFIVNTLDVIYSLPFGKLIFTFIIFFIGGFFLYGGLYAAVGSAVESIQEAQQFNIALTVPIIISIVPLMVIPEHPHSTLALAASIFPFTSPVSMMARVPFGVPLWEMIVAILALIIAVLAIFWIASRIYRIGILNTGSKVNYRTLWKWLFIKI